MRSQPETQRNGHQTDLRVVDSGEELYAAALKGLDNDRINILVNNAGVDSALSASVSQFKNSKPPINVQREPTNPV